MTNSQFKILMIEDNDSDHLLLLHYLKHEELGQVYHRAIDEKAFRKALENSEWDILISDYNVPGLPFSKILQLRQNYQPTLPLIVLSGTIGEESAVTLLKQDVWDFVLKGQFSRLASSIKNAVADAQTRRAKEETEKLFRNTVKTAPYGIIICDEMQNILLANPQAETLFGYQPGELLSKPISDLVPTQKRPHHGQLYNSYFRDPRSRPMAWSAEVEGMHKDGSLLSIEIALSHQIINGQSVATAVIHDISKRKENEAVLRRHTRALELLSQGNRTLLRNKDEKDLLQSMCELVVDIGGYKMAWVGYKINDAYQSVNPIAHAGYEKGYLRDAAISWGDNEHGQGPTGRAIRTGQVHMAKDFASNETVALWHKGARERGYQASVSLPLMDGDNCIGALTIYAGTQGTFDEMEVSILTEMADDLAFGIVNLRNTLARQKAELALKESYALLETTIESTVDGIMVATLSGDILRFNDKFTQIWNLFPSSIQSSNCTVLIEKVGQQVKDVQKFTSLSERICEDPSASYKDEIEMKDGRVIERVVQPHYMEGEIIGHVYSVRDITEQKKYEQQLTYLANHDALTRLPNRNLLADRLRQAIAYCAREELSIAVLFLDLDRFKLVNDSLGHHIGDSILVETSKRLLECVREGDTVARMGGDEFVILLPGIKHESSAELVGMKVLKILAQDYHFEDREILMSASIGAAIYPRDGKDVSELLKRADAAMYQAKELGGHNFKYYLHDVDLKINRHLEIATQLQSAITKEQLQVAYQPQFEVETDRCTGAEALLRWYHPELGSVSPAEFIPIAEESNLILKIGEWVLDQVFAQCKEWNSTDLHPASIAINISGRQFDNSDLPETLAGLLKKYDLKSSNFSLELEITESMLMRHPNKAIETLKKLKDMNFNISIDDFGTGYSSLSYLKQFPIDKLKIDQAFIKDIPDDAEDAAISRAVIMMAHELGLKVVAEGVETQEQYEFLKQHHCDYIQGYLKGKPISCAEFELLLTTQKT